MANRTLLAGAVLGGVGVALGALGAHGLADRLAEWGRDDVAARLDWFDTAARYQLIHAVALVAIANLPGRAAKVAVAAFCAGVLIFSGSLYAMATGPPAWRKLGMIVPVGGVAFLIGWSALAISSRAAKQCTAKQFTAEG